MWIFETWQQAFLAILVLVVFITFTMEWLSVELTALSALLVCVMTGILSVNPDDPANALRVFSHPAPITVACMFVLSASLERTGVIEALGNWFEKIAGHSPLRMLVVMIPLHMLRCLILRLLILPLLIPLPLPPPNFSSSSSSFFFLLFLSFVFFLYYSSSS